MKLAISLPDELFRELDACARRLRVSRSSLLAAGARDVLSRNRREANATLAWNKVLARAGQPGSEPGVKAIRGRSKAVVRARLGRGW